MLLIYLASIALMTYEIHAEAPAATVPTGIPRPKIVSLNCTSAYMPFSEADVAALAPNAAKGGNPGNRSTIPVEAACKGAAGTNINGICDLGSCGDHPVCKNCAELIITGNTTTTGKTVSEVSCSNNYFFGSGTTVDKIQNFCTDGNDKIYTCSGGCIGATTCKACISADDPALKSLQKS